MFQKHFEHFCIETLKYFLNLDHDWASQLYSMMVSNVLMVVRCVLLVMINMLLYIRKIQLPVIKWENIFDKKHPEEDNTYALLHLDKFKRRYPRKNAWGKQGAQY